MLARIRWRALLSLLASGLLLTWALSQVDQGLLTGALAGVKPGWVAVISLLLPVQVWLAATRWRRIAARLGEKLEPMEALREYFLSTLLNQVLPGGVAGDLVRVWRHRSGGAALGTAVRAALIDRGLGLVLLMSVALLGLTAWEQVHPDSTAPPGALPVAGLLLVGVLIALWRPWSWAPAALRALAQDVRTTLADPVEGPIQLALSLTLLGSILVGFQAAGQAVGVSLGLAGLTIIPLAMLAMSIPLSVGGWGLREATVVALLPTVGIPPSTAAALSLVYGLGVALGSIGGALLVLDRDVIRRLRG